jgi:hypothetical protein
MHMNLAVLMATLALVVSGNVLADTTTADPPGIGNGQSTTEVTVIAKMDPQTLNRVINEFVQSHAKPSTMIGQVGRWHSAVCPAVTGLTTAADKFVSDRIMSVARSIGAPTPRAGKKCDVNVEVVFTPEPQGLLDHVSDKYHGLLGFYKVSDVQQITTFSHPIQAWYVTGTRALDSQVPMHCFFQCSTPTLGDANGAAPPDAANAAGSALSFVPHLEIDSQQSSGMGAGLGLGVAGYSGSRLGKGLRSEFVHVLIIADSNEVATYPVTSISDYVALLALTHVASLDSCTELPSITNLFAAGCGEQPPMITATDTAYLKALYGADLDQNLNIEQGEIHGRMLQAISTTPTVSTRP